MEGPCSRYHPHWSPSLHLVWDTCAGKLSSDLFEPLILGSTLCYSNLASILAKADVGTQKMGCYRIKKTLALEAEDE